MLEAELQESRNDRLRIEVLEAELQKSRINRLGMLIANALIDLARLVAKTYKSEYNNDPSTTRLQQFAANTTDAQLGNFNNPKEVLGCTSKG